MFSIVMYCITNHCTKKVVKIIIKKKTSGNSKKVAAAHIATQDSYTELLRLNRKTEATMLIDIKGSDG